MGRPLRKDINGVDVIGTPATTAAGITVEFHDGTALRSDGIILKQRGAKTFVVARVGAPTVKFTCVLQSAEPAAAGQMRMVGFTAQGQAADNGAVAVAKITKRVITDFSGNRYTWFLENDSSADYIVLTAI
jgi:hypothetical protein